MSFWGPNMRRVIEWAEEHGIPDDISPAELVSRMDELTGVRTPEGTLYENAAAQWLRAIESREG